MLPRERVELALNHQEPDRIPIDLGGTLVSSITRKAYVDLRKYLGMPGGGDPDVGLCPTTAVFG